MRFPFWPARTGKFSAAPADSAPHRPIVLVCGMHRSGTSLTANILAELGVNMAEAPAPSPDNRKGHWERPQINDWHDRVFATLGRPWHSPVHHLPLPAGWQDMPHIADIRRRMGKFLCTLLAGDCLAGVKDPRLARLLPLWRGICDDLLLTPLDVVPWRDPAQVAASLLARDGTKFHLGLHRWLVYQAELIAAVAAAPVCAVAFEGWFADAPAQTARLAAFVNLPADRAKCAAIAAQVPEPGLRHDKAVLPACGKLCEEMAAAYRRAEVSGRFDDRAQALAAQIMAHEAMIAPELTEAEILRVSVAEQARVISDLQALVVRLTPAYVDRAVSR
jgi:hypothetical protein